MITKMKHSEWSLRDRYCPCVVVTDRLTEFKILLLPAVTAKNGIINKCNKLYFIINNYSFFSRKKRLFPPPASPRKAIFTIWVWSIQAAELSCCGGRWPAEAPFAGDPHWFGRFLPTSRAWGGGLARFPSKPIFVVCSFVFIKERKKFPVWKLLILEETLSNAVQVAVLAVRRPVGS